MKTKIDNNDEFITAIDLLGELDKQAAAVSAESARLKELGLLLTVQQRHAEVNGVKCRSGDTIAGLDMTRWQTKSGEAVSSPLVRKELRGPLLSCGRRGG